MDGEMVRIVSRLELERKLARLKPHPSPKVELEQYTTPTNVATDILFTATYVYSDVEDKQIVDLGCGSGMLSLGAQLLGAQSVVGVDIDPFAIEAARENALALGALGCYHLVLGDISSLHGTFDTVIMNPPFGTWQRHMDVEFLSVAMKLAGTIYSLHKSSTRKFLLGFVEKHGFDVSAILPLEFDIPHMFEFHRKRRRSLSVDLYRIVKRLDNSQL